MRSISTDLGAQIKSGLLDRFERFQDPEALQRYFDIVKANLYYDGKQYLVPQEVGGLISYVPLDVVLERRRNTNRREDDVTRRNDSVTNVYRGDVRKFVAVVGQRPPNVNIKAATPDNYSHQQKARDADEIAQHLWKIWDVPAQHMRAAYIIAVSGVAYFYTPWRVNAEMYGSTSVPNYQIEQVPLDSPEAACIECGWQGYEDQTTPSPAGPACPSCGSLVYLDEPEMVDSLSEVGSQDYENACCECHVYSGAEVATPFWIRDITQTPWLRLEYECDRGELMANYPEMADYIRNASTGGGDLTGENARNIIESYSKTSYLQHNERLRYGRYWCRPSQYNYLHDEVLHPGEQIRTREYLSANFPDGLKVTVIGDRVAALENESIDDVWAACQPDAGETLNTKAYMSDMIQCQDRVNDACESADESMERSIPFTFFDSSVVKPSKLNQMGRRYAEFIPAEPGTGPRLSDGFYQIRGAEPRPEVFTHGERVLQLHREITGIRPELFGASSSVTLGEAEMNRNQALMVLGLSWFFLRNTWARVTRNGIKQVARNSPDGRLYYPRHSDIFGEGVELPEGFERLSGGGWYAESDESMPMTAAQQRTWVERWLTADNPEILERLGVFHVDNLGRLDDVLGIPGWTIPAFKDYQAIMDVIERLLQQGGDESAPAESPDSFLHDPVFAFRVAREWLLSAQGKKAKRENPAGAERVYQWGLAMYQIANPPMPPEGMGPEGDSTQGQPPLDGPIGPPPGADLLPEQVPLQ